MAQALGQQLNLGPQPDFNNLVQHVNAAMGEVVRTPNLPLAGQGGVIIQLLQQIQGDIQQVQGDIQQVQGDIQQMQNNIQNMQYDIQNIQHDIQHIRMEQDLLPIKLYNGAAREHESLRYPQGVVVNYPPLPEKRSSLSIMTVAECQAAANHLGLPPPPPGALVNNRRRQIAEYLGAPLG